MNRMLRRWVSLFTSYQYDRLRRRLGILHDVFMVGMSMESSAIIKHSFIALAQLRKLITEYRPKGLSIAFDVSGTITKKHTP